MAEEKKAHTFHPSLDNANSVPVKRDCRGPEILLPWQRDVTFLLSINFFTQKKPKFSLLTVFPEPVWAQAIKSLPASTMGIACFWIGVGLMNLAFLIFEEHCSRMPACSKVSIAEGISLPVTFTGISSYLSKFSPLCGASWNSSLISLGSSGGIYVTGATLLSGPELAETFNLHIQLFWERLSEEMCTRQPRKVIWDMINTLFLTL